MATIGTFGSFGIAKLAIYASSAQLNVTGNNIANINTTGYCRQKLETSAMYGSGADQYAGGLNFGYGVNSDAISQYRDPYMDIRYRDENTCVGELETKLDGLNSLAFILDEVASGDADFGIIEAQFSEIVEQLQNLSDKAGSEEYDTLVRSACETLVQLFNSYANKLEAAEENQLFAYETEVEETNLILTQIRDLNEQIRNAGIYGDTALTLRDERNLLIDELSNKIGIDVVYTDEDVGNGLIVQNLTITIAGTDTQLVNGLYCTQLSMPETVSMPNWSYDEDTETFNFDTDASSSYMYLDTNGNPTNDKELASPWENPNYPDDGSGCRWMTAWGEPVDSIYYAGPTPNPVYMEDEDLTVWKQFSTSTPTLDPDVTEYIDNPDYGIVDGASKYIENPDYPTYLYRTDIDLATYEGDDIYLTWAVEVPIAQPEDSSPSSADWDMMYELDDVTYSVDTPGWNAADAVASGETTIWLGGEYAIGVWDDETGDWMKNDDGSYMIVSSTNNPYFKDTENGDYLYGLVPLNNYVEGTGQDNCYLLELSPLTDGKGNIIEDKYGLPITGSVLLDDVTLSGALQAHRELLVGEGEYSSMLDIYMDTNATTERGIPYYRNALDTLARKFAETFNMANSVTASDIFATNDNGVFMDKNSLLEENGLVVLDGNGNPMYDVLTGYDSDGQMIYISELNMYDQAYDSDGYAIEGMTNYDAYIYNNGVRDPNFVTDENGYYVFGFDFESESVYLPIQAQNEAGELLYTSAGDPIYLSPDNLTASELERITNGFYVATDSVTGELDTTRVYYAVTKEEYEPDEMFEYDEDNDCFRNSLGQVIMYEDQVITLDMAYTDSKAFDALMEEGVYTSEYSNIAKQGNLFSNSTVTNSAENITAANISISRDWSIGEVRIVLAKGEDPGSTANSNVLFMVGLMDQDLQYRADDLVSDAWVGKNEFFKGSFQEMLINTVSTLAQDQNTTTTLLINAEISALSLDNARLSVSGVDLNEEATNMMQYQKSYVAAAKLMTTLDEMIEVLLNM